MIGDCGDERCEIEPPKSDFAYAARRPARWRLVLAALLELPQWALGLAWLAADAARRGLERGYWRIALARRRLDGRALRQPYDDQFAPETRDDLLAEREPTPDAQP